MSKSTKKAISIAVTILLFALSLVTIVPFIWMFVSSFAQNSEIVKITGGIFPVKSISPMSSISTPPAFTV